MKCPDAQCHDTVVKLSFFMKLVGSVVTIAVTVGLALSLYGLAAEKKQSDHIHEHHTQIKVIEGNIKGIKMNMEKVDKKLDIMEEERKIDIRILHQRITSSEDKILKAIEKIGK